MNRKSIAKPVTIQVRATRDTKKRFEALADGWNVTYAEAMERLVVQAEKRNERKNSSAH